MEEVESIMRVLSAPAGVIALVIVTIWKLKPIADRLADRHIAFVDGVEKKVNETCESIRVANTESNLRQANIDTKLNDMAKKVSEFRCRYPRPPEPLEDRNGK